MSTFRGSSAQLWISTVMRVGLAGVLLWSGGAKVSEPRQAVMAVQAYEILPTSVGEFVGYALPLFELALGLALLLGVATRISAVVAGALMTAFVVGVASAWARGLSIDCGCFGGGGAVAEGEANYLPVLLRDAGFAAMAAWLVVFPATKWALDRGGRAGTGSPGLYDEWDDDEESVESAVSAHRQTPDQASNTEEEPQR
ncbi:MAG TPA: MauE/DoxX family redox-associated membrane protein [Actinomycetes bacterium]|jgi:uncharacterized membrane protein YphA (DoxX/SURF4 family)|nr:MauE/DoxX family redox-associated membrane protein [Actinomycetes bacterium]